MGNTLTLEVVSASQGHLVGLDCIKFIPTQPLKFDYGDINNDGNINAADALLALQHSVKLTTLEGEKAVAADVNRDGLINATDALCILQYSVKLIDKLPVA